MGRVATALVVGLVAVVVVAAVADSLRGTEDDDRPAAATVAAADPEVESRSAIAGRLRHEGVEGRLLYTDERCVLRAVELPSLAPAPAPGVREISCGFSLSPDGRRAATPGGAWSPDSRRVAVCSGPVVAVYVGSQQSVPTAVHDGCHPAWRPDGTLTLVRRGEVAAASGEVIVPASAIAAAARAHPFAPDPPRVELDYEVLDSGWVNATRVALLLRIRFVSAGVEQRPALALGVFEAGGVVGTQAAVSEVWTRLTAGDGFVALRPGWLVAADAGVQRLFPQPGVGNAAESVAVSPDRRWVAVAFRSRVTILSVAALRAGRFRSVSVPLAARDLAWR